MRESEISRELKIVLPLPPNRANARWHWRTEHRKRGMYWTSCTAWAHAYELEQFDRARIYATLYVHSRMDTDNLMARLKWPVDWLVGHEVIPDDSPEHLEWAVPEQVIDRKNPRVEIKLVEEA